MGTSLTYRIHHNTGYPAGSFSDTITADTPEDAATQFLAKHTLKPFCREQLTLAAIDATADELGAVVAAQAGITLAELEKLEAAHGWADYRRSTNPDFLALNISLWQDRERRAREQREWEARYCHHSRHVVRYERDHVAGIDTVTLSGYSYTRNATTTEPEVCAAACERIRNRELVPQALASALVAGHLPTGYGTVFQGRGWTVEYSGPLFQFHG